MKYVPPFSENAFILIDENEESNLELVFVEEFLAQHFTPRINSANVVLKYACLRDMLQNIQS